MTTIDPTVIGAIRSHDQAVGSTVKLIDERRRGVRGGLRTYLGTLDNVVEPIMPGDFGVMYAISGHNKTTRAMQWLDIHDRDQMADPDNYNEWSVYVTTETLIEHAMTYLMAIDSGIDRKSIKSGKLDDSQYLKIAGKGGKGGYAVRYGGRNIYFVGKSYFSDRDQPPLTPQRIRDCLWAIEDSSSMKVRTVFIDYLNRIDMTPFFLRGAQDSNTLVYSRVIDYIKTLTHDSKLQTLLLAQAKQALEDRNDPFPTDTDVEHTNSAREMADFMFGLMRPWKYKDSKSVLEKGKSYHGIYIGSVKGEYSEEVHKQTQLFRVNKQKDEDAPIDHWYWLDPATARVVHPDPYQKVNLNL